jgi:nicotinate-nucleotide--dimethylbenzimidazole phosphoribosyltransferase
VNVSGQPPFNMTQLRTPVIPPPERVAAEASERLLNPALAVPGTPRRLREVAAWLAATQNQIPPRQLTSVRLVVFAADYAAVSFPTPSRAAGVRAAVGERLVINSQAAAHGISVRILDMGVDDDFEDLPVDSRFALQAYKVRRSTAPIDVEDALSEDEVVAALAAGWAVAREEIAQGAQLVIAGDLAGSDAHHPATAVVAAVLRLSGNDVVSRYADGDDSELGRRRSVGLIEAALARVGTRASDPLVTLAALGSADLAAAVGFQICAARSGIPALVDGVGASAAALVAEQIAPGASAWMAAGTRATDAAEKVALKALGVQAILDAELPLETSARTVAGVPLLRSAAALLIQTAQHEDLGEIGEPEQGTRSI